MNNYQLDPNLRLGVVEMVAAKVARLVAVTVVISLHLAAFAVIATIFWWFGITKQMAATWIQQSIGPSILETLGFVGVSIAGLALAYSRFLRWISLRLLRAHVSPKTTDRMGL